MKDKKSEKKTVINLVELVQKLKKETEQRFVIKCSPSAF